MSSFLPMLYGILASFFFSFSFIMNRSMELSGGYWVWSATLRYLFMLPLLLLIVGLRGNLQVLLYEIRRQIGVWMGWSFVGFGLFYVPLCFSAAYGPGWLLAATWQITIIAGSLLAPLFKEKLPVQGLLISLFILIGVIVVQAEHSDQLSVKEDFVGTLPVLLAAFAYPLGNRKMMEVCKERLDTYQRVLGMTIASLPLWIVLSLYAVIKAGAPTVGQIEQSALVAVCSGVIATILFFTATERVKRSSHQLAAVEATQAGEIIFTMFGEMLFLGAAFPTMLSWTGMCCVIFGVIFHSLLPKNR